jgi:hypothetical protein
VSESPRSKVGRSAGAPRPLETPSSSSATLTDGPPSICGFACPPGTRLNRPSLPLRAKLRATGPSTCCRTSHALTRSVQLQLARRAFPLSRRSPAKRDEGGSFFTFSPSLRPSVLHPSVLRPSVHPPDLLPPDLLLSYLLLLTGGTAAPSDLLPSYFLLFTGGTAAPPDLLPSYFLLFTGGTAVLRPFTFILFTFHRRHRRASRPFTFILFTFHRRHRRPPTFYLHTFYFSPQVPPPAFRPFTFILFTFHLLPVPPSSIPPSSVPPFTFPPSHLLLFTVLRPFTFILFTFHRRHRRASRPSHLPTFYF